MKKIVRRIPEHYVGDDYFQLMLGYKKFMALLNSEGFVYMDWPNKELLNLYLCDERKNIFPYSNIPVHTKRTFLSKYNVVNQLLSFETPYLIFSNHRVYYCFALKDNKEALLVTEIPQINPDKHKDVTMNREELSKMLSLKERQFILVDDASWYNALDLPDQNILLKQYKWILLNRIEKLSSNDILVDAIDIDRIDKIPTSYETSYSPFLLINGNEKGDLSFLKISCRTVDGNIYNVSIDEIQLPKYSLLQAKNMPNAIYIDNKEPMISRRLNPNISSLEIEKAKSLILTKKK